jgi:hypothetical protein
LFYFLNLSLICWWKRLFFLLNATFAMGSYMCQDITVVKYYFKLTC